MVEKNVLLINNSSIVRFSKLQRSRLLITSGLIIMVSIALLSSGCASEEKSMAEDPSVIVENLELEKQWQRRKADEDDLGPLGDKELNASTEPVPPQMVRIRRKGATYDIDMNIFPGEENVFVKMDIPDEDNITVQKEKTAKEKKKADEVTEAKEKLEQELDEKEKAEVDAQNQEKDEKVKKVQEESELKLATLEDELKKSRENFNKSNANLVKSQKLFYKKRYDLALDEVNKALFLSPDFAYAHALKGSINFKIGNTDLAVESWKIAIQNDPSMNDVRQILTELGY